MFIVLYFITVRYLHYSSSTCLIFFDPKCITQQYSFLLFLPNIIITVITRNCQFIKSHIWFCVDILHCKFCHLSSTVLSNSQFSFSSIINIHITKYFIIPMEFCNIFSISFDTGMVKSSKDITVLSYSSVSASSEAS